MNETQVPEHTLYAIDMYLKHRYQPGSFLLAVLSNDLFGAFKYADAQNAAAMKGITTYIYNNLPYGCWGSPETVRAWLRGEGN